MTSFDLSGETVPNKVQDHALINSWRRLSLFLMGMDSKKLAARAKQPGHDRTFRESETRFVDALQKILDESEWEIVDHPKNLRRVIDDRYGVEPEASIRNRNTGNVMYFEE